MASTWRLATAVFVLFTILATTDTAVAGVPPTLTVAPAAKLVPLIVIAVPPLAEPDGGAILATVGGGAVVV